MTRVLVVDDQKIPRVAVSAMLGEAGYQVAAEAGGAEGLERARTWRPDVIVLDVQMPGMDGFQVVERLKQDPATAPIPVIFLTAEPPREELVVRGLELGAYDFLNKGCSRAELLARVGAMGRVKRGYDEMAVLARLSEILLGTLDPDELARRVAAEAARAFHADAAVLVLPGDADAGDVRAAWMRDGGEDADGLSREILRRSRSLGGGLCGVSDAMAAAREAGFARAAFVRVDRGERPALLLGVLGRAEEAEGEGAGTLLELLARQAALALDAALLHQQATAQAATLREQARALEQSMDERSRFFASVSHELRTPINAILGYSGLLAEGIYGPLEPAQAHGIERVLGSGRHLLQVVNDVLDISKMDAGKLEVVLEPVDLSALLNEVAATVAVQANDKGLKLSVDAPPRMPLVTDPGRVTQILLNLLSNAVKFTDQGGVQVRVQQHPHRAEVRVVDSGPGIAPEDCERIFSDFEQTTTATGRGGTGLGLAISRRLAVLLGGTLHVESQVGQGSTFVLRLPVEENGGLVGDAAGANGAAPAMA
jgi:signal transduction histidine kinase/AmiR/NasT family two-component response regulator